MVQVQVGRRFTCEICFKEVWICRRCDRGHRYCSPACRHEGRRRSNRQAGRIFRAKKEGKEGNARRQRDWYWREKAREETAERGVRFTQDAVGHQQPVVAIHSLGDGAEAAGQATASEVSGGQGCSQAIPLTADTRNLTHQGSPELPSPSMLPPHAAEEPAAQHPAKPAKPEIMKGLIQIYTAKSLPRRRSTPQAPSLLPRCHRCGCPCREATWPIEPEEP